MSTTLPGCLTKPLTTGGNALAADVERLTCQLQKAMQAIHGGEFRVQIEHSCGFVLVALRAERRPEQ